ncbi:MAG: phosphoesterase DHHA1 [Cenarchaeum symbiont of Oopsacas minuta]|nr:phosphoesterase DHHA1 [Cenarchaeum symbiont of Oopsacas minuta]
MVVTANENTSILCISHIADADGVCAAGLIKHIFGGDTILVQTSEFIKEVEKVSNYEMLKSLYICDFGIDEENEERFIKIMEKLLVRNISITYIDHHPLNSELKKRLKLIGIKIIHNDDECATVLVYKEFHEKFTYKMQFISACAAITDYVDKSLESSKLVSMFDRQYLFANATMLTYYISNKLKDDKAMKDLVKDLSNSKFPCEIQGFFKSIEIEMPKIVGLMQYVKEHVVVLDNLAYVEIKGEYRPKDAAHFIHGLSHKNVGIAYKKNHKCCGLSIKGSGTQPHLGMLSRKISPLFEGSGNGHKDACGCRIPEQNITSFIQEFNTQLGKHVYDQQ